MITENNTVMKTNISFTRIIFCLALPLLFSLSCWNEFDDAMERSPTAKASLFSDIQTAQEQNDSAVESTTVGSYAPGAKATLQTAIDNANTVYNDPASTTDDYRTALTALDSAVSAFNLRRIKNLDVVFVFDTTGDMAPYINNTKITVLNTMSAIQAKNSDTKFGLVELSEFSSQVGGMLPNGYALRNDLTTNSADITTGVNALFAAGGGDVDEAHVAAMYGTANDVSWTAGSDRIVILFTSSPAHKIPTDEPAYPGPTLDSANAAITAANIKPVGVYLSGVSGDGSDLNSFFSPLGGQVYPCDPSFTTNLNATINTIMSAYTTWWY
jgi:hypothetical protein